MLNPFLARDIEFIRLCGHRGDKVSAPENTLPAFRAAKEHGATSIELDTVLSADNEIVVLHDLLLDRTTNGKGAAKDMSAAEIASLDAGSWFGAKFAGTKVPTLRESIALAHELDLVLEVEIKEKLGFQAYVDALRHAVADPSDGARVMMISFDHAQLKFLKSAVPGIRTGGIVHERYADPVAVARLSELDQLCIDLDVFHPDDAAALHAANISIRCHVYDPGVWDAARRAGMNWDAEVAHWLKAGLIDTLSGDDVAWLRAFLERALAVQ